MRIGELAAMTGTTTKTLRFYEQQGLLPEPARTPAGYRDYPPEMADRIGFIRAAQASGLTLAQIAGILAVRDAGSAPCGHVVQLVDRRLDDIETALAHLRTARYELRALRDRARQLDPIDCAAEDVCSAVLTDR